MPPRKQLGQRNTAQRQAILAVIEKSGGPLTVNEILDLASSDIPNLGVATVYRTVKLLLEAGDLHAVILPDGQARYESSQLEHHHHFHCRTCQTVFDMPGCMMHIPEGTSLPNGFIVEDHEITLYGTCSSCSEQT